MAWSVLVCGATTAPGILWILPSPASPPQADCTAWELCSQTPTRERMLWGIFLCGFLLFFVFLKGKKTFSSSKSKTTIFGKSPLSKAQPHVRNKLLFLVGVILGGGTRHQVGKVWIPGLLPAKSFTLTSAPSMMSSLMRRASPRMAARCSRVSPRSFLLFTLSLVLEAELGVPF